MKEIIKEYLTALREEESLKLKKRELLKRLLHAKNSDGKELADIVLDSRCKARELLIENMPDDVSDDELWIESHSICEELYFMERRNHPNLIAQDNAMFLGVVSRPEGRITDGSHEGW